MPGSTTAPLDLRPAGKADRPVLEPMLFEAFHWNPVFARPAFEAFRTNLEFVKLLADWGGRKGDTGVVASREGKDIGAAWYRHWTTDHHSYGFVHEDYPEIALGVHPEFRGQGVGTALVNALVATAREQHVAALSLSVDPANYALRIYERAGFQETGASGTSVTMVLKL